MSLDDIWDAPVSSTAPYSGTVSPQKRPIEALFLSGSDNEDEQPAPKRLAPRPDVDALFADIDKDEDEDEDEDLRYKPLAPALDLDTLHKQAAAKHVLTPHQILPSSSPPRNVGLDGDDEGNDTKGKGKDDKEGKKERRKAATLNEACLVGPTGFPQLIKDIKGFKLKGKGHERSDLHRILQVYQFWTHRLFPKTPFKDTVERIEKLCHSKRMQVRLSVWRDEVKGIVNDKRVDGDDDIIDLTDRNIDDDVDASAKSGDSTFSRTASLPPSSSEAEDDDFDIDAVIREEEKRLAALRAERVVSPAPPAPKARYKSLPTDVEDGMRTEEEAMWDHLGSFGDLIPPPPKSNGPTIIADDQDEEMWDMVRELEREEHTASKQLPVSSVLSMPSANSASMSLGTNDKDFDDIYL